MEFLILGFFTGLSLILAIGAQNIFVELTLNICLIIFLIYFIYSKIKSFSNSANFNIEKKETTSAKIKLSPVIKPNTRYSI